MRLFSTTPNARRLCAPIQNAISCALAAIDRNTRALRKSAAQTPSRNRFSVRRLITLQAFKTQWTARHSCCMPDRPRLIPMILGSSCRSCCCCWRGARCWGRECVTWAWRLRAGFNTVFFCG